MIDLKKLSIYQKYRAPDHPKLFNERSNKWLDKDITYEEFMIIDKIDENFVCIRSNGYSTKMVREMEEEISELKKNVTDEVYEYLRLGKETKFLEPKRTWFGKLKSFLIGK